MSDSSCLMAIVVPAYKARFLAEALRSVAAQTDQRFRLYVFDDGSPEDLSAIFRAAGLAENASFHRFEQNVGGRSVVESWRRCVAATTEPWVWLFSDDDVMHPECVAAFYTALAQDGDAFNVYRFDTLVIDGEGRVIRIHPPHPARESIEEFVYHRLTNQRLSMAPEHIFRRRAYETRGGFVEFPHALGSDDATWINLAGNDTMLRGIPGPRVCWRLSGINISSYATDYVDKQLGVLVYARWLCQKFDADALARIDGRPTIFRVPDMVRGWFITLVQRAPHFYTWTEMNRMGGGISAQLGLVRWHVWLVLLRSNAWYVLRRVKRLVSENRPGGG